MAVEDYLEPEVAVAVAVTAAMGSPKARKVVRQGAVYGVAGVLKAGDVLTVFARGISRGVAQGAQAARDAANGDDPADPADDSEAILAPRAARGRSQRAAPTEKAAAATEGPKA